ncbi:hypothetical protein AB3S75_044179 [Citrus x aurantiifolia]
MIIPFFKKVPSLFVLSLHAHLTHRQETQTNICEACVPSDDQMAANKSGEVPLPAGQHLISRERKKISVRNCLLNLEIQHSEIR